MQWADSAAPLQRPVALQVLESWGMQQHLEHTVERRYVKVPRDVKISSKRPELAPRDGQTKGNQLDFEITGFRTNRVRNSEVRLY